MKYGAVRKLCPMSSWMLYFGNFTNFHTVAYIIWTPLRTICASAAAILSNISAFGCIIDSEKTESMTAEFL